MTTPETGAVELAEAGPGAKPVTQGRRFGRYVLCFELASGGMATVYLARAEGPQGYGKLVAIKMIQSELAKEEDFVGMFLDEARIASQITHPNVCSVFDFGEVSGSFYIAMEYLVGEPLSRVWRRLDRDTTLTPQRRSALAAKIIADACEGLHAAHELVGQDGRPLLLVHRDVSPQVLFVTYDGSVKVVDFGIAKAAGRAHRTQTGDVKGKFPYISPEQIRELPIDRRADLWSLGVCLWELVTGKKLFPRDADLETLHAVLTKRIPAPSEVAKGIPRELDALVLKALERSPDERYATARDFGRALNTFVSQHGALTSADLSDWMTTTFAAEHARRRELSDMARRIDPETEIPRVSDALGSGTTINSDTGPESMTALKTENAPTTRRRSSRTSVFVVLGLSVVVAAVGAWWTLRPAARPERTPESVAARSELDLPALLIEREQGESETGTRTQTAAATGVITAAATDAGAATVTARAGTPAHRGSPRRSPVARTPPPPSGAPGTLNVVTPGGWSEVYIDGRHMGRSPLRAQLAAGRHTIEIEPLGQGPRVRRTVEIESSEVTRASIPLGSR